MNDWYFLCAVSKVKFFAGALEHLRIFILLFYFFIYNSYMFFGVDPPKFPEIGQAHRVHARRQRRKNIENRSRLFFAFPYFYNEKISTIEKTQKRSKLAQYGAAINSDETNWNELWNSKHGSIRFLLSNDSNHRPNSTDFIVIHRGNITSRPINVITFKTAKVV